MRLEIEINETKDLEEVTFTEIEVETPAFTMATDTSFNILQEKGLGATSLAVYLTILKHRNMKTNKCFPSIATISKESGFSIPSTKKIIKRLEESGYLSINSGYKGTSNNYYFPKEWFYEIFKNDFFQQNASRRQAPIQEKRETKIEKENRELKEQLAKLKIENNYNNKESLF